mgnify:CR=1 FL=1
MHLNLEVKLREMTATKLEDAGEHKVHEKPNVHGDKINLILLTFMYTLQGALYGFSLALPIYFQNRKVSYADQVRSRLILSKLRKTGTNLQLTLIFISD